MSALLERLRRLAGEPWATGFALGAGALLVAVYAARYGVRVSGFALDESVVKQQAVNYSSGLPGSVFHDVAARGPSRLYSFVESFVFRLWSGDTAVKNAKVLNAFMFASTAVPVWLLARKLLSGRWAPVAAGLLAIAAPWLALTTTIFTENLSYPLFAWFLLAVTWCLDRPGWWRDLVVVALAFALTVTRIQLWTVVVLWPVAALLIDYLADTGGGSVWEQGRRSADRSLREHPVAFAVIALGLIYVAYLALVTNTLHAKFNSTLGTYSEIGSRDALPQDYFTGIVVEVVHFGAALGVLPVVASLVFWCRRLTDRGRDWEPFFAIALITVGMFLATLYAQGGYAGSSTEERYYMYLIPLAWIGALGLLELPGVRLGWLALAGGIVVLLFATVPIATPLTSEYAFLAAGGSAAGHLVTELGDHIGGMKQRDMLALLGLLIVASGLLAWARRPGWRRTVWIGIPVAFQICLTLYVFGAIDGRPAVTGVAGRTGSFDGLAFVDDNLGDNAATWLDVQRKPYTTEAEAAQRVALFWNQRIEYVAADRALRLPSVSFPLSSVTIGRLSVDPRTGRARATVPFSNVVVPVDSPFLQLAGTTEVARSANGSLALVRVGSSPRIAYRATGLTSNATIKTPARLAFWVPGARRVTLRFGVAQRGDGVESATPAAVRLTLGSRTRVIAVAPDGDLAVPITVCAPAGRPAVAQLSAAGGLPQLRAVELGERRAC